MLIEIAKQDMHYAEFAEDEVFEILPFPRSLRNKIWTLPLLKTIRQSAALLAAIKEYEANKWKTIGAKVGKPAKVIVLVPVLVDVALSFGTPHC